MKKSPQAGSILGSCLMAASGWLMLAGSTTASAPSSLTEQRGYGNCVQAANGKLSDLKVEKTYYINTQASSRQYYLNARAKHDGEFSNVRIVCKTTRSGRRVLDVNHTSGRYLGRIAPAVAQN